MNAESLLETRGLAFAFGSVPLLHDISLEIPRGSLCTLIGSNGSGKSTLMRLLAGLLKPGAGTIHFNGEPLASIRRERLARSIAFVAQSAATVFPFTALEVVLTGRHPHLGGFGWEGDRDLDIARESLQLVGAEHLADRPVPELSAGERQLVLVARAIAQSPQLLLLDEPSASLDLRHRAQLVKVLRRLRDERGISALVVTHDLMLLEPSFDHVYALSGGRLIAAGAPAEILQPKILRDVYCVSIHTLREEGKIFVWSEV